MCSDLTCATCEQPIAGIDSALVEWLIKDRGASGFKIIHDFESSPRAREGCSWHVFSGSDDLIQNLPAAQFADPEMLREALNGGVQDTSALLTALQVLSGNPCDMRPVIDKLAALGALGAPALSEALASEDSGVRRAAALALARLGRGARPAADGLARALTDADKDVRFRAAFALKVLGDVNLQDAANEVIDELTPVAKAIDALEPFTSNSMMTRGLVNRDTNLRGEVGTDVTGFTFLAPEEDYRGGGMGSIRLYGCSTHHGLVKVISGIFDADIGMWAGRTEPL